MNKHIVIFCCLVISFASSFTTPLHAELNSIGIDMVSIGPGSFLMGGTGGLTDYDEAPAHLIRISRGLRISSKEITNSQYELFDPEHKKYRGKNGFSTGDNEAVIYVSWDDAVAFCQWLSEKEGKQYRLPTEAEWEYACRAGSMGPYSIGDRSLPKDFLKNQNNTPDAAPISLETGRTAPNAWGLYDMHGNVEEWCLDYYGPYLANEQTDPAGYKSGYARVCRGGSHNTPIKYLRSSNRSANLPQSRNLYTGFRIVEAGSDYLSYMERAQVGKGNKAATTVRGTYKWTAIKKPFFAEPERFIITEDSFSPKGMFLHNHCPAATWLPNGELLVIWFSCMSETDREMTILQSRYSPKTGKWSTPEIFFNVADRNLTGSALHYDEESGLLYHFNGLCAAGCWKNLSCIMRTSADLGHNWSDPVFVNAEYEMGNQVIDGVITTSDGKMLLPCDATPNVRGGSIVHISSDKGKSWKRSDDDRTVPQFRAGATGNRIAGIHARIVELSDGSLLAFGRDDNIASKGKVYMTRSISRDGGHTWQYSPTCFPPISSGQRLVLMRLNEGPLLLLSFTDAKIDKAKGMVFRTGDKSFTGYGLYAALSYDEGETWPVRKLITDGRERYLNGGAFTGYFKMDSTHAEPKGYLTAVQSPDNIIHIFSSSIHYALNIQWLTDETK